MVVYLGTGDPRMDKGWNENLRSVSTNLSLLGPCTEETILGCVCVYLLMESNVS